MKILQSIKVTLPLLLLAFIGLFLWKGLSINPRVVPSVLVNEKTPEFNLPTLVNPQLTLSNRIFKGHVSLLNVWATWCVVCADEYPVLMSIAKTHEVKLYGLDYKDNRKAALKWLNKYGDPFNAIGFDKSGDTAINWGVYGTPETFIIDKEGIIRYKQIGEITNQIWQDKLLPIVKKLQKQPT